MAKPAGKSALRLQYAALPYRFGKTGVLELLIVTTRQSRRWIIPKGWPMKGHSPAKAAAREAYEEAGVRGEIRRKPIGVFVYDKFLDEAGIFVPCEVKVFALRVKRQEKSWPEKSQREVRWVPATEAVNLIADAGLKPLILGFAPKPRKRAKTRRSRVLG